MTISVPECRFGPVQVLVFQNRTVPATAPGGQVDSPMWDLSTR